MANLMNINKYFGLKINEIINTLSKKNKIDLCVDIYKNNSMWRESNKEKLINHFGLSNFLEMIGLDFCYFKNSYFNKIIINDKIKSQTANIVFDNNLNHWLLPYMEDIVIHISKDINNHINLINNNLAYFSFIKSGDKIIHKKIPLLGEELFKLQ